MRVHIRSSTAATRRYVLNSNTAKANWMLGPTGVGKSATVGAAAKLTDNVLIRFNMSSQITIDDLLGKVVLAADSYGSETFLFLPGPFTSAFRDGKWLLLDELNLAQDTGRKRVVA